VKAALDGFRPRHFRDDAVVLSERDPPACRWCLAVARDRRGVCAGVGAL
jgi:hypothetical protein